MRGVRGVRGRGEKGVPPNPGSRRSGATYLVGCPNAKLSTVTV